ncbi:sulfatase-like hydrolase/transferase [Helicobacter sp. 23-1045]
MKRSNYPNIDSANRPKFAESNTQTQIYPQIAIYATLCIALLICVFNPYALYNSDITQFDSTQTKATLGSLFGAFLLASFSAIYALSFIPQKWQKIPAFALSVALFIGIAYSFIFTGDYGAMDRFWFDKHPFVYDSIEPIIAQMRIFIAVLVAGILFVIFALKYLLFVWKIIFATLLIVSGIDALKITKQRMEANKAGEAFFSYSKTDKNIVVIVLDMFSGSHTPFIFTQFPHLKGALDGFTLYPNAISSANLTIPTAASLIGGEYYTAINMNKRAQNLITQIDSAFINTANAFAQGGFSANLLTFVGSNVENIKSQLSENVALIDYSTNQFVDFYAQSEGFADDLTQIKELSKNFDIAQLLVYGAFKFAPEFEARKLLYDDGWWRLSGEKRLKSRSTTAINYTANFYATSRILKTDSAKPTFKFIWSLMTHSPFGVYFDGQKCDFFTQKTAWDDFLHPQIRQNPQYSMHKSYFQHYDAESCALQYLHDFVANLKNAGIYDNTQIFVISDHAGNDNINFPLPNDNDKNNVRPDVLFLFKDFGARGELKVDRRLMANFDIVSIFCANLPRGCPNVPPNILQNYPQNRELIHTATYHWMLHKHKPQEWLISNALKVRGDIYKAENWRKADEFVNMK